MSQYPANVGNIALRWSAKYRVQGLIYKHLAPLGRIEAENVLLHFEVEFANGKS